MFVLRFMGEHPCFSVIILVVNLAMVWPAVSKTMLVLRKHVIEACGRSRRDTGASIYAKGREAVLKYLDDIAKTGIAEGIRRHAEKKLEKAGYQKREAILKYLLARYLLPVLLFVVLLKTDYPNVIRPVAAALLVSVITESIVKGRRVKLEKQFNRSAYKIYKYLHNQVSSGIRATDAVKTAYEVVNEAELRQALMRMAARYEITKNIESALEELVSRFDIHDTHTLCTAIRLGVMTGDNGEMLARQEEIMFKKYFNYIQAETEGCRMKSLLSAAFFTAVIIILISVPLVMDVLRSINSIFSS